MTGNLPTRRRVTGALALVAAGLIGGLGATAANATFSDVPDESAFSESIENLQEAGIATGFEDGSFRPGADITRRQTAAWVDRAASRVGLDLLGTGQETVTLDGANPTATLQEVEMTSPAAGTGSGWVTIQGGVGGGVVSGGAANCPCVVRVNVVDSHDDILGMSILTVFDHGNGLAITGGPVLAVVPLAAGETETYRIELELLDPDVSVRVGGAISATYTPLAEGEPDQLIESQRQDPTESLVPDVADFPGAP